MVALLVENRIRSVFGKEGDNAVRIARCESGLNPAAHNGNALTGDDSWGIFQVNRFGALALTRPPVDKLVDADYNIRWAYQLWKAQGWWGPWGCARKLGIK